MANRQDLMIFLSVGRYYRKDERAFVALVESEVRAAGLATTHLTADEWHRQMPVLSIERALRRCDGVVVVAFSRVRYGDGTEWPASTNEAAIRQRELPSVWLQIEAAVALTLRLPVLALIDSRLHGEGVLNPKHGDNEALTSLKFSLADCQNGLPLETRNAINAFSDRIRTAQR